MKLFSLLSIATALLLTTAAPKAEAQSITWNPNTGAVGVDLKLPTIPPSVSIPLGNLGSLEVKTPTILTQLNQSVATPVAKYTGKSIFSIDLDDGKQSQQAGIDILKEMKIPATLGIITQANTPRFDPEKNQYFSDNQIKELSRNAYLYFASHTSTHVDLATASPTVVRNELVTSRNYLQKLIAKKVDYLILPYCSTNATVNSQIRMVYAFASICGGNNNLKSNFSPLAIDRKIVESNTTLTQIQSWIDEAKKVDKLTVFVYHDTAVNPNKDMDQNVTPPVFKQQMQLLKNSGVPIMPTAQAAKRFMSN